MTDDNNVTTQARAVLAGLSRTDRDAVAGTRRAHLRTLRRLAGGVNPLFVEIGEEWPTEWERTPLGREVARLLDATSATSTPAPTSADKIAKAQAFDRERASKRGAR